MDLTNLTPAFSLRPQAGPSGLSFLLVNPLQRVTKYPLLLQKILENTLPDASAYPVLQRAASALQDVVTHINEYKRRKEVASRYTKVEQLSLRERLARINTHTLSKKTTRLSQLLKQEAGLVPKLEDKEFDDLEEKFHCVSLCVTELKSNVAAHLDALEVLLRFRPHESHLDIPGGPVAQYGDLARDLQLQAFPQFVSGAAFFEAAAGRSGVAAVVQPGQSPGWPSEPDPEASGQTAGLREGRREAVGGGQREL